MTDGLVWRVEADWTGVSLVGATPAQCATMHPWRWSMWRGSSDADEMLLIIILRQAQMRRVRLAICVDPAHKKASRHE